jgi:two-component system phosphate regulon sensor histidine kinase PhoR
MQDKFSFRTYLILSFWIVLVISLLIPTWYYYHTLTEQVVADARQNAIRHVEVIDWMMAERDQFRSPEDLQKFLVALSKLENLRISYLDKEGRVIADSATPFEDVAKLDGYGGRPEILQAQTQEIGVSIRPSRANQKEQIFAARRTKGMGAIPAGILRVAVPFSQVKDHLVRLRNIFIILIILVFVATLLLSRLLVRQLGQPIRRLIEAVESLGNRDYGRRLRFLPGQEFYVLAHSLNQVAEKIENHISSITKEVNQLAAVFNGMREGVMVLDAKGRIQSVNQAFVELIPYVPKPTGRRPLEVIMNLELQDACDKVLKSTAATGNPPYNLQIQLEGDNIYDVSLVRLQDEHQELGAIVVFHDISQLKRLERVRQDFVANVSHELHTPLTSIKGYTETLLSEEKSDPETTKSFLEIILKNTNHMVKVVNDLLQLARLEAAQKKITLTAIDAGDAMRTAWKACEPFADHKQVSLDSRLPETGVHVSADFDQLVQVFRNLLENAVRYSPPEKAIIVSSRVEGNKVTFGVYDEGPGIPKQHQLRIFERFYRVEKHRSGFAGSTGLGLAICRHIIQNHGGLIWVQSPDSETRKGTTIFFTLLRSRGTVETATEDGEPLPDADGPAASASRESV